MSDKPINSGFESSGSDHSGESFEAEGSVCKGPEWLGMQTIPIGAEIDLINVKDFEKLLSKSKLILDQSECDCFRQKLGSVVQWLRSLDSVDLDDEPQPDSQSHLGHLFLRDDEFHNCRVEEVLFNAPETEMNYFVVDRMKWKE